MFATCQQTQVAGRAARPSASGRVSRHQAARCKTVSSWKQQQRVALPRVSDTRRFRASRAIAETSASAAGPGEVERAPGPAAEIDLNDPEEAASEQQARDIAIELAVIADETRAADVRVLGVSRKVHWARYFVLATAFNRPQMQAVASKMRDHLNENHGLQLAKNVTSQGDWVCVDCGEVVVHVFTPSSRDFYDIEALYRDAVDVELPFETERPEEDEFEVF